MKKVVFGITIIVAVGAVIFVKFVLGEQGSVENNNGSSKSGYTQISMKEAKDIFKEKGNYIILDDLATAHL